MNKWFLVTILIVLALGWMVGIYKLSGMNSSNSNGKSTDIIGMFIEDTLDLTNEYGITDSHPTDAKLEKASNLINAPMRKVIHATVYFMLALFIMLLLNIIFEHKKYWLSMIIAIGICIVFAITDEYHQTLVAGRTGQLLDVLIDSAGAMVGILFYSTYQLVYKNGYRKGLKDANNVYEED